MFRFDLFCQCVSVVVYDYNLQHVSRLQLGFHVGRVMRSCLRTPTSVCAICICLQLLHMLVQSSRERLIVDSLGMPPSVASTMFPVPCKELCGVIHKLPSNG